MEDKRDARPTLLVQTFPSGPFVTNAYVLGCQETRYAAIVDPGVGSSDAILQFMQAQQLVPQKILLTHSHWDHIAEVAALKKHLHIPIYIHFDDISNLENPGSDGLPCWIQFPGIGPDECVKEGDEVLVGALPFTVIHTPGHSPGGVCYYCLQQKVLISGDTLFRGTHGNIAFPTSSPKQMGESLKRLAQLPPDTVVFPGHGLHTTIGEEEWLFSCTI